MAAQNKFTTCQFVLEKCDFFNPELAPTCVKNWCEGEPYGFGPCTEDFNGTPAECCSQDDVAACMVGFQSTQGYGIFKDACGTLIDFLAQCAATDSGFNTDTYAQQAECLCYDSDNSYDPDTWDDTAASCYSTGQQAHPTIWNMLNKNTKIVGLCTNYDGKSKATATGSGGDGVSITATLPTTFSAQDKTVATGTMAQSTSSGSEAAATTAPITTAADLSSSTSATSTSATTTSGASRGVDMGRKWAAMSLAFVLPGLLLATIQ